MAMWPPRKAVKKLKQTLKNLNWVNIAQFAIVMMMAFVPVLVAQDASAQAPLIGTIQCPTGAGIACNNNWTLQSVFQLVLQIAIGLAFLISVLVLVYGGFLYITAAGNQERATQGKNAIFSALIGLAIVFLSYVVVSLVYRFLIQSTT